MTTTLRRTRRQTTRPVSRIGTTRTILPAPAAPVEAVPLSGSTRPVPEMLRELAFMLHATRVVGRRPEAPKAVPAAVGTPRA